MSRRTHGAHSQGLGVVYAVPTKSSSSFIPDQTLYMDIPIAAMAEDAIAASWPNVTQRVSGIVPGLLEVHKPALLALAPEFVAAAWPTAQAMLMNALPQVTQAATPLIWAEFRPIIRAEAQEMVRAEEKKVVVASVLTAAAVVGVGLYVARRLRRI